MSAEQQTPAELAAECKSQAQVFASAWSLVGGRFDCGDALENANEQRAELDAMIDRLAYLATSAAGAPVEVIGWMRLHPNGDPSGEYLSDAVIEDVRRRSGQWIPLVRQHAASAPTQPAEPTAESTPAMPEKGASCAPSSAAA